MEIEEFLGLAPTAAADIEEDKSYKFHGSERIRKGKQL